MRKIYLTILTSLFLMQSGGAFAESPLDMAALKSGILPTGHFYTLYEVECKEAAAANIVAMQRKTRWCMLEEGELNCFGQRQLASKAACQSVESASGSSGEQVAIR
jgi:hypothetical protein